MDEKKPQAENTDYEITREVVVTDAPKMKTVQRIISLIASPRALMENIKLYPVILVPLVICVIIGLISVPVNTRFSDALLREQSNISLYLYGVDVTGMTDLMALGDVYGDFDVEGFIRVFTTIVMVVNAVFSPLLMSALGTLGVFILMKILRGSATFAQLFSMHLHIYILYALGMLVSYGLMGITGNLVDPTSLAALLMPAGNISMVSFNLLMFVNIFNIWYYVLFFIGVKVLGKISNVKAAIIAVFVFATAAFLFVFSMMSPFIMARITMGV